MTDAEKADFIARPAQDSIWTAWIVG